MALCATGCSATVPRWVGGCNIQKRQGGISQLVFMSCNVRFATSAASPITLTTPSGSSISVGVITDYLNWALLVQNNMVRTSPEGIGEKPESSFTTARFSSCRPEEIASQTHTINFQSFDVDTANLYDNTYWNQVRTNYGKYKLVYFDCNGLLHYSGDVTDPGFDFVPTVLDYVIPSTYEENPYYQANLAFNYQGIPAMVDVPSIETAFTIDVNT